jgi:hypothetical protein
MVPSPLGCPKKSTAPPSYAMPVVSLEMVPSTGSTKPDGSLGGGCCLASLTWGMMGVVVDPAWLQPQLLANCLNGTCVNETCNQSVVTA